MESCSTKIPNHSFGSWELGVGKGVTFRPLLPVTYILLIHLFGKRVVKKKVENRKYSHDFEDCIPLSPGNHRARIVCIRVLSMDL